MGSLQEAIVIRNILFFHTLILFSLLSSRVMAQGAPPVVPPKAETPPREKAPKVDGTKTAVAPSKPTKDGTATAPAPAAPVHAPTKLSPAQKEALKKAEAAKKAAAEKKEQARRAHEREKYLREMALKKERLARRNRRRHHRKPHFHRPRHKRDEGFVVRSNGFKLKLSGFLQLHTVYASESTIMVESPLRVADTSLGSTTAFSPRFSRFKLDIAAPNVFCLSPSGVFELDFYGNLPKSGTSVRQPQPRMRLAYGQIKRKELTIRFGNDWMVAAPQFASTLQPFNLWGQGNLWMRYPQLKVKYVSRFSPAYNLSTEFSVGENMGGDSPSNTVVRNGGMGEYAGTPTVPGRLGFNFKLGRAAFSTIGVSGSWQRLDLSVNPELSDIEKENVGQYLQSYFWALDGKINYKLHGITISGTFEYHQGQGIGMYWGGILQTVQYRATDDAGVRTIQEALPVKSIGYFGDVNVRFPCGFGFYGGHGKNTVDEDDLFSEGAVLRNQTFYGGLTWKQDALFFGLGGTYMRTDYLANPNTKDAFMIEALARYTF